MITVCPNCGHPLNSYLNDGLIHCSNCNIVFDSSIYNSILSASWIVRRQSLPSATLSSWLGLSESDAKLVYRSIEEEGMSHDEFICLLKKMKIPEKSYIDRSV